VVIYESTVYPGATEEVCVPILEQVSGPDLQPRLFAGYSPERINPGDKEHRLPTIVKVTSGSTPEVADFVDALYRGIITAGTHKASSIRVAEAAKVIENTQRDVNIALINELALIFNRLGIDTQEVLEAAGTKWNFLPFRPGLVGGHCIGVDPYYLTHKAQEIGYHPEMILAGRRSTTAWAPTWRAGCQADAAAAHARGQPPSWSWGSPSRRTARTCATPGSSTITEPGAVLYDVKHLFPSDAVDGRL
jgi:UDP-N-acetyl-D-glucosamine/UDP-N-acetyl-D-galactosamine dehydrogenase